MGIPLTGFTGSNAANQNAVPGDIIIGGEPTAGTFLAVRATWKQAPEEIESGPDHFIGI
jgi:hypothetical protein